MDYKPGMFKGAKVAVLGLGVNNVALTRWLVSQQAEVTVCDENPAARSQLADLLEKVKWQLGKGAFNNLGQFAYLFRTPGLRPDHEGIKEAVERGQSILTSQTELFFALSPAPIIGVTGTKGKGTTASLLLAALKQGRSEAGIGEVFLAGNIGTDPFAFLKKLTKDDLVILELSSFQLMQAVVRPHVAIILSLSPDHLDYHLNMPEYAAAKASLVRYQESSDIAIFHEESEHLKPFLNITKAQVYLFSRTKRVDRGTYVGFDGPRKAIFMTGEKKPLFYADDLVILGEHNLENAAAAALAAYLLGVSRDSIRKGFSSFTGLPHRLQKVASENGIDFIDDSIATTKEAMLAAVESFLPRPIHLIAGGVSKVSDMAAVMKIVEPKCASITLIGQNRQDLAAGLTDIKPFMAHNMEEAITHIMEMVHTGDVVLLSPASASFDMYKNYAERGDDFARRVKNNLALVHANR